MRATKPSMQWDDKFDAMLPLAGTLFAFIALMVVLVV